VIVHELDESIQIEKTICHMLGNYLTMEVYEDLGVGTHHPGILLVGIELATVYASVQ
jgi:hypothetical protein